MTLEMVEFESVAYEVWYRPEGTEKWGLARDAEQISNAAEKWDMEVEDRAHNEAKTISKMKGYDTQVRKLTLTTKVIARYQPGGAS